MYKSLEIGTLASAVKSFKGHMFIQTKIKLHQTLELGYYKLKLTSVSLSIFPNYNNQATPFSFQQGQKKKIKKKRC